MKSIYKIVFTISVVLALSSIIAIAVYGLPLGVDFKGGTLMDVRFENDAPSVSEVRELLTNNGYAEVNVTSSGNSLLLRLPEIDEETHRELSGILSSELGDFTEERFDSIGPVIGNELKNKTMWAMVLVFLGIVTYIAYVFRKLSGVLSPWAMGLAAILALTHDVIVPLGIFTVLGAYYGFEMSAVFVAAILTILGYSVSDSVIIFDRVRENIVRFGTKGTFTEVVHQSVMQTLSRSINTSLTTLLPLAAIFLLGGETLSSFALFLIIGIFLGAYSSLFIASPLLVWLSRRK